MIHGKFADTKKVIRSQGVGQTVKRGNDKKGQTMDYKTLHRKHYTENIAQKTLHRKHYSENTTQKTLHRKHYTENTTQKTLHRKHYTENTTQKHYT